MVGFLVGVVGVVIFGVLLRGCFMCFGEVGLLLNW